MPSSDDAKRISRFIQPADAIDIVYRAPRPSYVERVEAGESLDSVASDMALDELAAEMFRTGGGSGSGNFEHSGRPGSVGGSSEGGSEHIPRQGEIDRLTTAIAQKAKMIDSDEYANPEDLANVDSATRGQVKAVIVSDLADRLIQDPRSDYALTTWQKSLPAFDPHNGAAQAVQRRLDTWARTSGDSNGEAIGMQHAVAEEFGLTDAALNHFGNTQPETPSQNDLAYVRAEYENTQAFLSASDVKDVSLFRGVGDMHLREGEQTVTMQPASSWTTDLDTAQGFTAMQDEGSGMRHILTTRVPAERVLSTAVTGRGALSEAEVLLLGGPTKVTVFRLPNASWTDAETTKALTRITEHVQP
jgi:hypothetical protein